MSQLASAHRRKKHQQLITTVRERDMIRWLVYGFMAFVIARAGLDVWRSWVDGEWGE